jgi:glycerol uptake facilitator-like aquaporin
VSEQRERAEQGVLGWIDRDITGPMADFRDPSQEWRRLFSESYGTFLLVLVAAGGGMMSQAFPNTISRTAAVVAPALMVMAIIMFMGKVSGAAPEPGRQRRLLAARRLSPAARAGLHHRAAGGRDGGGALPALGDRRVGDVRLELSRGRL